MGMDHASRKIDAADTEIPALSFEEAVAFMKSRVPLTKAEWNDLEPRLRFRAFTVAHFAQCDYIDTARQVLSRALDSGKGVAETYRQWQTIQTLVEDDAMKLRPGYWENVFRTNTQTAYTAGKLMRFQNNPPPAWRLLIVEDTRTSDICRGLIREGKQDVAMSASHPFWKTYGFPPYHYQCRTGLQAVYQSEIEDGAVVENPALGELQERFKPLDGFGGNPLDKESWWQLTDRMVERASRYGIDGEIVILAHQLGMKNYALDLVRGYKTLYSSGASGYVKKAALANPGKENRQEKGHWVETDEFGAAKKAADAGHQVFFLPRIDKTGISNPDVIINNELADIKHIFAPTKNAIIKAIKRARKQGVSTVLLEIVAPELSLNFVETVVKEQLGSRIRNALVSIRGRIYSIKK